MKYFLISTTHFTYIKVYISVEIWLKEILTNNNFLKSQKVL